MTKLIENSGLYKMEKPGLVGGKWLSDAKKPNRLSSDPSLPFHAPTKSNFTTTDEDDNSFTSVSSSSSFANANVAIEYSDQSGFTQAQDDPLRSQRTTSAFARVEPSKSSNNNDPNAGDSNQIKSTTTRDKSTMKEKKKQDRPRKLSQRNLANTGSRKVDMGKLKPSPPTDNKTPTPGILKEKSTDHAQSTATTRTLSAGDLTYSSGTTSSRSSHDQAFEREYHGRRTTRQSSYTSRPRMSTAHQLPSVASSMGHSKGSSTWAPVDEMWGLDPPSVQTEESERTHDTERKLPPSFEKQKSKRKKKLRKPKRSGTPSKREIMESLSPPPLSDREEKATKHVRKTQRRSESEKSITQESPHSVSSSEGPGRGLSTRDEFRAFLIQDRESQRNLIPDHAKKGRSTSRRGFIDPYASKTDKPSSKKEGKKERKRKKKHTAKSHPAVPLSDTNVNEANTRESRPSENVASVTPTSVDSETSQRLRMLGSKQASMSTIESVSTRRASISPDTISPDLTTFFEWNRSPSEPRRRVHHTPSSRGTVDRRELLRKAQSTSDVNRFHLTPEWPAPKRNGRLHSMFYDLSLRRHGVGPHGGGSNPTSPGVPSVSARQMLSIMEPCSRREVMTAQGLELEPPLSRDDSFFNVGEILDNISLTSSQRTNVSSQ